MKDDEAVNEIRKAAKTAGIPLGPTGDFPEGKLEPHDEGAIRIAVGENQRKVIIDFGKPIAYVGLTPAQAIQLANSLIDKANLAIVRRSQTAPTTHIDDRIIR